MKYDRQDVIEKATNLFWEKGFHATSMRNLQDVLDMRPGSIYAGFNSKEGLFEESLRYYTETNLQQLTALVENAASPLAGVKEALRTIVKGSSSSPSGVCMLVKTVTELTEENAELLAVTKQLLKTVESAFTAFLQKAKDAGELNEAADPERLAHFLQMQLMGLRSYALANDGNIQVDDLLDDAFACLN